MQMTSARFLSGATVSGRLFCYALAVACVLWISLFYFQRPSHVPITASTTTTSDATASNISSNDYNSNYGNSNNNNNSSSKLDGAAGVAALKGRRQPPPSMQPPSDPCSGRYVYIHDLPSRFNTDIVRECHTLCASWTNMDRFMSNAGLGPALGKAGGVFPGSGSWYDTDQFALDVIFYNRMKQYACLTDDSSRASAVFVPFFAGLDTGRYLLGYNTSVRDAASLELARWLRSRPEWGVMGGRDHFLVAGRIAWDVRRYTESDSDWGNKLLRLPEARNMSVLVLESGPWNGSDFSIPYPTYFHPSKDGQVLAWQKRMRRTKRPWLFSFAGAPRPNQAESIRGHIIKQCRSSRRCRLLDCSAHASDCHSPSSVIRAFQSSSFCLQPPGDSFTRRSAFDAMVAGCIPVFFHPGSAYAQYRWHLPNNHSSYSVFIPEEEVREGKVSIEERLAGIPEGEVRAMRDEVIKMIPRLVYADPRSSQVMRVKDAFEVAVEGVIERVGRLRKEMRGEVAAAPRQ